MDTNKIMEAIDQAIRSRDVTLQNVQGIFQKPFIGDGYKVRGQDVILCDISAYYYIQEVTCIADTRLGKVTLRGASDGWECDIGGGEFVPYSGDKRWSDKCTLGHDGIIFDLVYEYLVEIAHKHVLDLWDELDAKYGVDNIYIADAERGTEIYLTCGFVDFEKMVWL